jgi:hypothetical protein
MSSFLPVFYLPGTNAKTLVNKARFISAFPGVKNILDWQAVCVSANREIFRLLFFVGERKSFKPVLANLWINDVADAGVGFGQHDLEMESQHGSERDRL